MTCETCGEWLDEYREGTLPADVRSRVEEHLRSCAACRTELEASRWLAESVSHLPRPAPGAEVCMRVSEAIHKQAPRARRTEFGPVLDFDELAEFLRVDAATLEQYVGDIPCFELGGRLLFRKAKVEEWIEGREMMVGLRSDRPSAGDWGDWSLPANVTKGEVSWMLSEKN